jgi:glucose/arabinose dehydrogenase
MRKDIGLLVFIDATISDIETLIAGVDTDTVVVQLNPECDAIAQITGYLNHCQGIKSLHIVSHGAPGQLKFADAIIDRTNLAQYQPLLASWKQSLDAQGSILIYGCEVGAGLAGRAFVKQLHQLTGLPVTASETLTGDAAVGGDWMFAVRSGKIPTASAFSPAAQRAYSGILGNTSFVLNNLGAEGILWSNGNTSQSANSLLLTADKTFQASSSYYLAPVQIDGAVSFQSKFQFRLGGSAGTLGSDGFSFVFQNADQGANALGSNGGNVGYGGINKSFAIKFDTYKNDGFDANDNSIAVIQNGQVGNAIASVAAPFDLNGGQILTAWVEYNGLTDKLDVYLSDTATKPGVVALSTTIDIAAILGSQAFVGFTAGSGSIASRQEIFNWDLATGSVRNAAPAPASPQATLNLATLTAETLNFNGGASRSGTSLELTPDKILQRGSAFYATPFQVANNTSFQTQFQFKLDGKDGTNGADGFSFVLQNAAAGAAALGNVGSAVGLYGIEKSLGIKFDTFQNPGDAGPNSVSIVANGDVYNPLSAKVVPFDLNNGANYTAWVEYDGLTNQLSLFLSDGTAKPAVAILTQTVDLAALVGNQAYAGFTGSSGAVANRQTISSWQFASSVGLGGGDGLRAEYFDNADFTNLKYVQIDPTVNFDWGVGSPSLNLGVDDFSVRWFGQVQALYDEAYTFYINADDGVRLTVNGQVLVDALVGYLGEGQGTTTLALEAGKKYDIQLEYVEAGIDASAQLSWSSATQQRQVIPTGQLFTTPYNPGTILMGSEDFSIAENVGKATVRIDRVGGSDGYATVTYNTVNGTAQAGADFVGALTAVTFKPGEISKLVDIDITDDALVEVPEQFAVALGQTAGAGLGTRRTANIQILDNDAGVSVFNLSRDNYQVNEGAGTATISVQRSGDTTIASSVRYTTTAGTATAGADFVAATGVIDFAANELIKTFAITINEDTLSEVNETLNVLLSAPDNGALGTQVGAVVAIQDNDLAGNLVKEDFITGLLQPTAFEFAPGGELMFVAEKGGVVKVFRNGVSEGVFIDISEDVNSARDRGLLGIAIHPEFFTGSPYIYDFLASEAPQRDQANNRPSRLSRITADVGSGYTRAVANSNVVILGKNSTFANTSGPNLNSTTDINPNNPLYQPVIAPSGRNADGTWVQDYLATDSESHSIGDVAFGKDGALYVTNGDGTSYSGTDARTYRVQDPNSLSGKMLRLNPLTGEGLAGNMFFDPNNPNSNASKVFNTGLRNPFRFTFNPITGDAVIGDVGWTRREEINVGGGKNFGWPYFEGGNGVADRTGGYDQRNESQLFFASNTPTTGPAFAYTHDGPNAVVVGDFYQGPVQQYQNGLFASDAARGTVDVHFFNAAGTQVIDTRRLATNSFGIVQMIQGVDGSMYFASLGGSAEQGGGGSIGRWRAV